MQGRYKSLTKVRTWCSYNTTPIACLCPNATVRGLQVAKSFLHLLNVFYQNIKPFLRGFAPTHTFQRHDGGTQFFDGLYD
jgi:hypothetical protein